MARKYNPDIHSSVVSNVKDEYKRRYEGKELILPDARIWYLFDEWSDVEDTDHLDDKYFALYEVIHEENRTEHHP